MSVPPRSSVVMRMFAIRRDDACATREHHVRAPTSRARHRRRQLRWKWSDKHRRQRFEHSRFLSADASRFTWRRTMSMFLRRRPKIHQGPPRRVNYGGREPSPKASDSAKKRSGSEDRCRSRLLSEQRFGVRVDARFRFAKNACSRACCRTQGLSTACGFDYTRKKPLPSRSADSRAKRRQSEGFRVDGGDNFRDIRGDNRLRVTGDVVYT